MDPINANTASTLNSTSTASGASTDKTEGKGGIFAALFQSVAGDQEPGEDAKDMPLTNEQLAMLLQQFGATPALMTVLMENPEGNPVQTLAGHPELLSDLSKVMTTVMNTAVVEPNAIRTEAQLATLMKAVMAEVNGESSPQQLKETPKQQLMLGKLQATMSTHIFRGVVEQAAAKTEVSEEGLKSEGPVVNTPVTTVPFAQATSINRMIQPTTLTDVVTVKAENLNAELPDMIIKRASLIEAPGRHDFRIILEPSGLGEIEIHVQKIGEQISLHIKAENVTTKGLLDSGMANLKAQLQAQGIQYDRIEVSNGSNSGFMGDLNSGFSQERGSRNGAQNQSGQQSRNSANDSFSIDAVDTVTTETPAVEADGIDVSA